MFRTGGDPDDAPTSGDGGTDDPAEGDDRQPELIGVFDWEMSTLGDPRADLGWLLSHWWEPKDPEPAFPDVTPTFTRRSGYPSRRELVDRYEERTGIAFEHARFYRALAVYKLAALGEMFYRRYLEGNSDDPTYPKMKERVPALAQRAKEIVDGDRPL
jgi:aminoglycoside phosphotransferase (APT) family kinase protein